MLGFYTNSDAYYQEVRKRLRRTGRQIEPELWKTSIVQKKKNGAEADMFFCRKARCMLKSHIHPAMPQKASLVLKAQKPVKGQNFKNTDKKWE